MQRLNGKVALVTGGGRGLGREICQLLAQAGMVVVSADVSRQDDLVAPAALGRTGVSALELDVSDRGQVADAIRSITANYGHIDVLVNNAGIDKTLSLEDIDWEDWDRILNVNLRGPVLLSKYVFPIMRLQGGGHIINIVSTAAKRAWANASAYHASKWGLLGFSHALHVEARRAGIKVTAVVTGGMRTPFLLDRFPDIDVATLQHPGNVAEVVRYLLLQPAETVIPEVMVIPMRETSWP